MIDFDINSVLNAIIGGAIFLGKYEFKVIKNSLQTLQDKIENINSDNVSINVKVEHLEKEITKLEDDTKVNREHIQEVKELILELKK
jgi:peptidoglycan hydrolase CwlO-like protein